jgi:integrase/recombinase XerD
MTTNIKKELIAKIMNEIEAQKNDEELSSALAKILECYTITAKTEISVDNIDKYIKQFLSAKKIDGLSPESLKGYYYTLKAFHRIIKSTCGNIDSIGVDNIRDYIVHLQDTLKLKDTTLVTNIRTLNSFFTWLHVEEIILKNPMMKIKTIKIDRNKARNALSLSDLEQLRNTCETYREKAIVEFFVSSGCRLSEALNININEIDFHERCVKVLGKGKKERIIYFSHRAKLMIEKYVAGRKGGDALFCSTVFPYNQSSGAAIQHTLKGLGKRAELEKKLHPHILRHTFATHALNAGMDITVIQKLLGHTDISTTQIYAKTSQERIKYEYNKFAA